MNTKLLMTASAVVMGILGIITSFMPEELLQALEQTPTNALILIVQITGSLYFGFAIINWMARSYLAGGIYAKPLTMGNFAHFLIAGIAIVKAAIGNTITSKYIFILVIIYLLFAIAFGIVAFTNPKIITKPK